MATTEAILDMLKKADPNQYEYNVSYISEEYERAFNDGVRSCINKIKNDLRTDDFSLKYHFYMNEMSFGEFKHFINGNMSIYPDCYVKDMYNGKVYRHKKYLDKMDNVMVNSMNIVPIMNDRDSWDSPSISFAYVAHCDHLDICRALNLPLEKELRHGNDRKDFDPETGILKEEDNINNSLKEDLS